MDWKRTVAIFAASVAIGTPALAAKGGGGGGGGGLPPPSVLPTTPPEANVVLRESFGPGPDLLLARPQGGSGGLRNVFAGTDPGGLWLREPGGKEAGGGTPAPRG